MPLVLISSLDSGLKVNPKYWQSVGIKKHEALSGVHVCCRNYPVIRAHGMWAHLCMRARDYPRDLEAPWIRAHAFMSCSVVAVTQTRLLLDSMFEARLPCCCCGEGYLYVIDLVIDPEMRKTKVRSHMLVGEVHCSLTMSCVYCPLQSGQARATLPWDGVIKHCCALVTCSFDLCAEASRCQSCVLS